MLKIVRLSSQPKAEEVQPAVNILLAGGLVVYPTETVYGLGVDALNPQAVDQVRELKGRASAKPMLVLFADQATINEYAYFDERAQKLAKAFWPGPLTMALPPRDELLAENLGDAKRIAVRLSSHPVVKLLTKPLGRPLLSTSANLTGHDVCYNVERVVAQFENQAIQPEIILDGGKLSANHPSTVIDLTQPGVKLLRQGFIAQQDIESVLN